MGTLLSRRFVAAALASVAGGLAAILVVPAIRGLAAQEQAPTRHEIAVRASNFRYVPGRIEVRQNDILKISFHAEDAPHAFTIDAYRISKRAGAGQTVVFEFRADQPGSFPFYSNLTSDERYRDMRGELIVR